MSRSDNRSSAGFTLVEVLVALVLMSLIAALVVPQIDRWLSARERATIRSEISSKLALLPLQVARQGEAATIENAAQLDIDYNAVRIIEPIKVLENGFCIGGQFALEFSNGAARFNVIPPLCEVVSDE